jgi:hypothetical protein
MYDEEVVIGYVILSSQHVYYTHYLCTDINCNSRARVVAKLLCSAQSHQEHPRSIAIINKPEFSAPHWVASKL